MLLPPLPLTLPLPRRNPGSCGRLLKSTRSDTNLREPLSLQSVHLLYQRSMTMRSFNAAGRLCRSTARRVPVAAPARQGTPLHLQASKRMNSTLVDRPIPPPFRPPPPPPVSSSSSQPPVDNIRQEDNGEAARRIFLDAVAAEAPRQNWTRKEIASIYYQPLMELVYQAVSSC